ncbi:two pore domain potassium channel family protein [Phenylobacterium sp. LjRoot219]|uniref:two pore domain potassium channel family protein n=1 Tax=Phenylobacterium sp. LjRoot219 TaxID=3342283 RepID=UPI003ECF1550
MYLELLVSTGMVALTVIIHALGLSGIRRIADILLLRERDMTAPPRLRLILLVVLGLFLLHGFEIWLYAGLYQLLNAVETVRGAVYLSTVAYATLGYTEEMIAEHWHLVAAVEGINGILLLGWTTAFFVTTMEQLQRRRRLAEARHLRRAARRDTSA